MDPFFEDTTGLRITVPSANYLSQAAKWGKLISIVGFISIAFMVIFAFLVGTIISKTVGGIGNGTSAAGMMGGGFVTVFYLAFAVIYFFPVLYLYRFSTRMKEALYAQDEELLQASFESLKSLFAFMGVLTLIFIVLSGLGLLLMVAGIGMGAMM